MKRFVTREIRCSNGEISSSDPVERWVDPNSETAGTAEEGMGAAEPVPGAAEVTAAARDADGTVGTAAIAPTSSAPANPLQLMGAGGSGPTKGSPQLFAVPVSLQAETATLSMIRRTDPVHAQDLMAFWTRCCVLAATGQMEALRTMIDGIQTKLDVIFWFVIKMFRASAAAGHADVVEYILDNGFDMKAVPSTKHTCYDLVAAVAEGDASTTLPVVELLVRKGAMDINYQRSPDFFTVLHLACERGLVAVVERLVGMGADVNAVGENDAMPLSVTQARLRTLGETGASGPPEQSSLPPSPPSGKTTNDEGESTEPPPTEGAEQSGNATTDENEDTQPALADSLARIEDMLLAKGAKATWRRGPAPSRPASYSSSSSVSTRAGTTAIESEPASLVSFSSGHVAAAATAAAAAPAQAKPRLVGFSGGGGMAQFHSDTNNEVKSTTSSDGHSSAAAVATSSASSVATPSQAHTADNREGDQEGGGASGLSGRGFVMRSSDNGRMFDTG